MAFTQADLDTINKAIGNGALEVRFADRTVTYRSMEELLKAKANIEAELSSAGTTPMVRQIRPIVTSGW